MLSITGAACDRLPVFGKDTLKDVASAAVDEARRCAGFAIFAYVVRMDLEKLIWRSPR